MSNLAERAKDCSLGRKLHDSYAFESFEVYKTRLRQSFVPPRAEFRARAELLDIKQGKRDVHAYAQHVRYLSNCIVQNPMDEHTLIALFIKA